MYDLAQFVASVLSELHAPDDGDNRLAFSGWHACEGGVAGFNPLNTTLWQPGCTNYNNFGPGGVYHVRNYPDFTTGVRATALTLDNGHYPHIMASLHVGNLATEILRNPNVRHELDVWGTGGGHVAAWLEAHHGGQPAPLPPAHPHRRYVVRRGDTLSAIAARYKVRGGWEALYAENRHTIGTNPNEIRPGEVLAIP